MKPCRHIPPARALHPNVTPLIDVVMVLIVFFMLVARIGIATGADPAVRVPATVLGADLADVNHAIMLNVRTPQMAGGGPVVTAVIKGVTTSLSTVAPPPASKSADRIDSPLVETLRYARAGDPIRGVPPDPALRVVIRADESLDYQDLQPVLEACAAARVSGVSFDTRRANGGGS